MPKPAPNAPKWANVSPSFPTTSAPASTCRMSSGGKKKMPHPFPSISRPAAGRTDAANVRCQSLRRTLPSGRTCHRHSQPHLPLHQLAGCRLVERKRCPTRSHRYPGPRQGELMPPMFDAKACAERSQVGERVTVIPNHICPCINLQDVVWWKEKDAPPVPIDIQARG